VRGQGPAICRAVAGHVWTLRARQGVSAGLTSPRCERQRDRAAEVRRRIPCELAAGEVILGHALEESLHCNFGDETRHLAAKTEMLTDAEAQVALGPTFDVVDVGITVLAPIAIA